MNCADNYQKRRKHRIGLSAANHETDSINALDFDTLTYRLYTGLCLIYLIDLEITILSPNGTSYFPGEAAQKNNRSRSIAMMVRAVKIPT